MNRIVGFDRPLRRDWLNATLGLVQSGLTADEARLRLDSSLVGVIPGAEARRKTIVVLIRLWYRVPLEHLSLRARGVELAAHIPEDELLWLHWGMSLLAYPFFRDVAATIGQLGSLQGAFTLAQVRRRVIEGWGQRTLLQWAVGRLLRTLTEWRVLRETDERGCYVQAPSLQTHQPHLALWLMECSLYALEAEQVPLAELGRLAYTFPFDLASHLAEVRRSGRFEIVRQGHDLEMVSVR